MLAPVGVKVAGLPAQIVAEFTVTVGFAITVTVATAVAVQVPKVPVMVYV